MDFEQAGHWVLLGAIVAGFAAIIVAGVLARRRAVLPSRGFGWMVTDTMPGGVGYPSMVVIDCYLTGGAPPGATDASISFTVQAKAGARSVATVLRSPSFDELPSRAEARVPEIVNIAEGVWRVDAPLLAGSSLRIRLHDVEIQVPPILVTSTPDARLEPLDRMTLGRDLVGTTTQHHVTLDAMPVTALMLMNFGIFSDASMRLGGFGLPLALFVFSTAGFIYMLAAASYMYERFGGLMLMHFNCNLVHPLAKR